MKICFIADFFADEVNGGGELSNEELINILSTKHDVSKIKSIHFLPEHIEDDVNYVVCNFIGLREDSKSLLKNYIIYEHDHKYLDNRNPAVYNNFTAPKENIVNYDFYKNAKSVICQSTMHKEIVEKNLKLDNIISIGGNLWSEDVLDLLENYSKNPKSKKYSIMNSHIGHKNTPETLSRIIVESRMMDMKVITNKLPGAVREPWFEKRGVELIDIMRNKRQEISDTVINIFEE